MKDKYTIGRCIICVKFCALKNNLCLRCSQNKPEDNLFKALFGDLINDNKKD